MGYPGDPLESVLIAGWQRIASLIEKSEPPNFVAGNPYGPE
jgi:hypothetical protein